MLFSISEFREFIMRSDIDAEPFLGLKNIFQNLSSAGTKPIDIKDDFLSLRTECMEEMTDKQLLNTQEDAAEFLTACILKKIEFIEQLPEFLKITKKSYAICDGIREEVGESSTGPSLIPIDFTATNIQDNLTNTFHEESELNRCPGGYVKYNFFAGERPKYIILSLNRFVYNVERGVRQKVDKPVEINNRIEIPFENGMAQYKIKGFISHVGPSASEGHYYYTGKGDDNKWRTYNDTRIEIRGYVETGPYLGIEKDEKKKVYILLYELVELAVAVRELNRRLGNLSIDNVSIPKNKNHNVTRGRKYAKRNAIQRLENRRSVSRNTKNAAKRKALYGRLKEFTDKNLQGLINRSRAEKGKK